MIFFYLFIYFCSFLQFRDLDFFFISRKSTEAYLYINHFTKKITFLDKTSFFSCEDLNWVYLDKEGIHFWNSHYSHKRSYTFERYSFGQKMVFHSLTKFSSLTLEHIQGFRFDSLEDYNQLLNKIDFRSF